MVKKFFKVLFIILGILLLAVVALIAWLSFNEYIPAPIEGIEVMSSAQAPVNIAPDDTISIISWNIGYSGLGKESDFFMDGGENVAAADKDTVNRYLQGIYDTLYAGDNTADILMLQEIDTDSDRSHNVDELSKLAIYNSSYAINYSCPFVPYPLPPIGKVNAGLLTNTTFNIESSERISLPCPFSWPISAANLKRCLLVSYLPIEGSDKQLVIVNLHLEAYDDGEGKIAQTKQLVDFIQSEYDKGNYVIAGGDFNQVFPRSLDVYPNTHEELWTPGVIEDDMLPDGWTLAYDSATPTCRLLNQPYDPADTVNTQYYVIDGFIVSPNVTVSSVKTLDLGFENSDHNPVRLEISLVK